jgi:group I intron endonuclease
MVSGIYWIRNISNGKIYIGSSCDIKIRWNNHINELNTGRHANAYLQRSWIKYGKDAFKFQVIEETSNLKEVEQWYLDNTRCTDRAYGYNMCTLVIGGQMIGKNHSEATKAKLSAVVKTPEWRAKISASHKGIKQSEATKEKKRLANLARYADPAERLKTSLTSKAYWEKRKAC